MKRRYIVFILLLLLVNINYLNAFTLSKMSWFEVLIPISFSLNNDAGVRVGIEINVYQKDTDWGFGGGGYLNFNESGSLYVNCLYNYSINELKNISFPINIKAGWFESDIGICLGGGIKYNITKIDPFLLLFNGLLEIDIPISFKYLNLFLNTSTGFGTIDTSGSGYWI
jgi:hypothetical protein